MVDSQDAGALHCPNCGGPAKPEDRTCEFCHAVLATISCPKCFARMFAGTAYCPKCGAPAARAAAAEATRYQCPSCRAEGMRHVQVGPTDLLECAKCGGVWVEAGAFEKICADGDAQAAVLHQWSAPAATKTAAEIHYRPCPECHRMMNRVNFSKTSGTVVDVCKGHGTFLDAGELHQIVSFIQGGGLERARQQQIEDLKAAEKELRAAELRERVRDIEIPSYNNAPKWTGPDLLDLLRRIRG